MGGDFVCLVGISRLEDVIACQSVVAEEGGTVVETQSVRRRDV